MTIALNVLLAAIVFIGVVGLLAYNILAARTPAPPRRRPEIAQRPAHARQRAPRPDTLSA